MIKTSLLIHYWSIFLSGLFCVALGIVTQDEATLISNNNGDNSESLSFIKQAIIENALTIRNSEMLPSYKVHKILMNIIEMRPNKSQDRFIQFSLTPDFQGKDLSVHETYLCSLKFQVRESKIFNNQSKCESQDEYLGNENNRDISKNDLDFRFYTLLDTRNDRKRRDVEGASNRLFTIAVPPNEMKQVTGMANFAMQTLDLIDVDSYKRKVIDIVDAKKQLTPDGSGIMYYLEVNTQDTQCPEDLPSNDPETQLDTPVDLDCLNSSFGPLRACRITLLRSWVPNSSPVNAHVVKSECGPPE